MPNINTHIRITAEALGTTNPDVLLGSTLPDFVGMYRDYTGATLTLKDIHGSRGLREGMSFHNTTDGVFDNNVPLLGDYKARASQLLEPIIGRKASRVCAGPGTDILLDGELLNDRASSELYLRLQEAINLGHTSLMSATSDPRFGDFVRDYFNEGIPVRYQDPRYVAQLLQSRLRARGKPDYRIEEHDIPAVTEVFSQQIRHLRRDGMILLKQVIHELSVGVSICENGLYFPEMVGLKTLLRGVSGIEAQSMLKPDEKDGEHRLMHSRSISARIALRSLLKSHKILVPLAPKTINSGVTMPEGWHGSITHTGKTGWVGASIGKEEDVEGVGIDLESLHRHRYIGNRVLVDEDELPELFGADIIVASLKEAGYKAMGISRRVDFKELKLKRVDGVNEFDYIGVPLSDKLNVELAGTRIELAARVAGGHVLSLAKRVKI